MPTKPADELLKDISQRITTTLNADGGFEGVFTLHIEQYGLKANDKKCDVKITRVGDQWQIWVQPVSGVDTPHFKQFVESLNQYLFSVLQVNLDPKDASVPKVEVFFDDIYFDMSGHEPVIQKISSKNDQANMN